MLYVDPEWKGQGIGWALLQAVADNYAEAKAMRLEVLRDNVAAIAWYKAQGFETYGGSQNATGMPGVAALYMDKRLDPLCEEPPC
jgi:ribosomal protein S18 acetylase RimI-like enzyme